MIYSKYTNMTNDELVALTFNHPDKVDDLSIELAGRLITAEEELSQSHDCVSLGDVLDKAELRVGAPDRRQVRVEGGRREND